MNFKLFLACMLIAYGCMATEYYVDIYDKGNGKWQVKICNEHNNCVQKTYDSEYKNCKTFECVEEEAARISKMQKNLVKKAIKELN